MLNKFYDQVEQKTNAYTNAHCSVIHQAKSLICEKNREKVKNGKGECGDGSY